MQRTRWQTLLLVTVVTGLGCWALLHLLDGEGVHLQSVPWLVIAVLVVLSGIVFAMGWAVRQFLRGKRPTLDPIRAARTAVLAKASAYTGSLLAGWYIAQVLLELGDLAISSRRDRAVAAGIAAAGAILLAIVGLVVEWFCRVPPPEDKGAQASGSQSTDPAAA